MSLTLWLTGINSFCISVHEKARVMEILGLLFLGLFLFGCISGWNSTSGTSHISPDNEDDADEDDLS